LFVEQILSQMVIIQAAMFVATACVVLLLWNLWDQDARVDVRLREVVDEQRNASPRDTAKFLQKLLEIPQLPRLAEHLIPNDQRTRSQLQARLLQAGLYRASALQIFFVARLAAMLLPPLLGALLGTLGVVPLHSGLLYGAILGGLGMVLPGIWLDRRVAARHLALRRSLPDFLDLFVACVESGLTLRAAIAQVTDELRKVHPELSEEFSVSNKQIEFGSTLETAMQDLAARTKLDELRSFSTFVQQAQRFGATMGAALRDLADMLRTQRELRAEELAQKAAVKILIPTLLFIFPTVFVVLAAPAAIKIQAGLSQSKTPANSTR
jgi:tight adherence protein C